MWRYKPIAMLASPEFDAAQGQNGQQIAYGFESMEGIISGSLAARRFTMTLLVIFAGLAVLHASVGIYGSFPTY